MSKVLRNRKDFQYLGNSEAYYHSRMDGVRREQLTTGWKMFMHVTRLKRWPLRKGFRQPVDTPLLSFGILHWPNQPDARGQAIPLICPQQSDS